jgi:hypothetical protein
MGLSSLLLPFSKKGGRLMGVDFNSKEKDFGYVCDFVFQIVFLFNVLGIWGVSLCKFGYQLGFSKKICFFYLWKLVYHVLVSKGFE